MPWLPLTTDHVLEALSGPESAKLRTQLLADGQDDPLPGIVERTALEVRGYVAARYGQAVGQAGTVPHELLSAAVALARWRLLTRLPLAQLATAARQKEYDDALQQLRDVAAGKFAITPPTDADAEQPRPEARGAYGSTDDFA